MEIKLSNFKEKIGRFAVIAVIIIGIGLPAILSVRHKYELKQSAMDVVSAIKKAQSEAESRGKSVALAIDRATGTCMAFVDDGALAYEQQHNLPLTPERAANLRLDPNETVLFRERIHRIDTVNDDREHPFPKAMAVKTASGELVGGISVDGKLFSGVEFNNRGVPTNLGMQRSVYKPCRPSSIAGLYSAWDIKSKTNPVDRYQVALNSSTGKVHLLLSVNRGECYQ